MVRIDRNIIRGFLILFYIVITSILLFLISSLFTYLNTGADRSKTLHTELKETFLHVPKTTWKLDGNIGRMMDAQTLNNIEKNYLDAWYVKHLAYQTNQISGIEDYYTKNARKNLINFIKENKAAKISIEATTLKHNPNIEFFSEDGQLVVLEDKNVLEYKKLYKNNKLVLETTELSNYRVLLLLEDGFWRIRHLVKEAATPFKKPIRNNYLAALNVKGVNYYPKEIPWDMFGDDFDLEKIDEDFELIKNTGINTLKVFIPNKDFDNGNVKSSKLNKLKQVLSILEKKNIKVIVTLFDFQKNIDVLDWTFNHKHAETIKTTEVSNLPVLLSLDQGLWRIRHLVNEADTPFDKSINNNTIKNKFLTNLEVQGINYYPQATPWDMFGDDFDISKIDEDFDIIKNARLNTIRIFIPYEDFGKENVKTEKLEKLKQILDLAEEKNIKVIVTLFDFYGNYDVLDWTFTHKHVETIVSEFKDHKAIVAWDVKNEPNLDFKSRGKQNVISWLEHIIILIKSIDKDHAITIGWSNIKSAPILKNELDFVSFHYYEDINKFEKEYKALKDKIPNKKIVLGEFGLSSYGGFWKLFTGSEKKQATYFKNMQKILTKNDIPFISWTLYDFDKIPSDVVGKRPWRVKPQKKFGFIKKNGDKKLSYKYISR